MKFITLASAALLASSALGGAASAATFHPTGTSFTGTGNTNLTKFGVPVPCTATFAGTSSASGTTAQITSAVFSGSSACTSIRALGLPWSAVPTGTGTATINNVSVQASIFGTCGPTNVPVTISTTGVITFSGVTLSGSCTINGSVATTPALTVY